MFLEDALLVGGHELSVEGVELLLHEHFGLSGKRELLVAGELLLEAEVEGVEVEVEPEVLGEGGVLPA